MRTIRTRLFSFIMVLCLFVSLLPMGALAAADTVLVDGKQYYSEAYDVLELINKERTKAGLGPLAMSASLLETAMLRASELSILAGHTRPNGQDCFTAFPTGNFSLGENVATGYYNAEDVMNGWMNSPGHKDNILKAAFKTVGIGCFEHNGVKYWVQCFSSESASGIAQPKDQTVSAKISLGAQYYTFKINGSTYMSAGVEHTLSVSLYNSGIRKGYTTLNPQGLTWTSSNPKVVVVKDGVCMPLSEGTAVITASSGINSASFTVSVYGEAVHTHKMEYVAAKPATYQEAGIMAHWICTVCQQRYTDQKGSAEVGEEDISLPKLICTNHQWDEGTITTAPTPTASGVKTFTCTRCLANKTESIPPITSIALSQSGNLDVSKPTQADLMAKYAEITDTRDFFVTQPSVTAPHATGKLTDALLNSGLSYLNFARYVAGLPTVQLSDSMNQAAQYGAVLLAAVNYLSHTPSKPADMAKAFYDEGYAATTSSNISMRSGYSDYNPVQSSIQGCLDDSGLSNLSTVGHRRWLLNPVLLNVGFGFAQSQQGSDYITTKVFDRSGNGINYDFIAWPTSGNFPTNIFANNAPWSLTLNPSKYRTPMLENLTITMTRASDNKVWIFNGSTDNNISTTDKFITVENSGYGVNNCIIFRPSINDVHNYNGSYIVTIDGLQTKLGKDVTLSYQVDFFTLAECVHAPVMIPAVPPTCEEDGLSEGSKCSICGEIISGMVRIPALGHVQLTVPAEAATCEETGLTEGLRCEVCDKILLHQEIVPALGHDYESKVTTAATCTTDGELTYTCKNDASHTYTETIPMLSHTDEDENGYCDACDALTCEDHKPEFIPAVPADCTKDGKTEGSKCSICNLILTEQKNVPALGHNEVPDDEILPTCTESGLSEGSHCERCGIVITKQAVVPALGHDYENGICTRCEANDPNPDSDCYNGTCGDNLTWHVDINTGTLTISGTGAMYDYDTTPAVWSGFTSCAITRIVVEEGVTSIGACAFMDSSTVLEVRLPSTLESIGKRSFTACPNITNVYYEGSAEEFKALFAPEHWGQFYDNVEFHYTKADPTPTPVVTPTPTPVVTPTPTPVVTPTPTPVVTPTPTPVVTPTPTPVVTPTPTPVVTPTPTPVVTPTPTPVVTPTPTPVVTPTPTPAVDNPFTDVGDRDWFLDPVLWAVQNNVTGGLTATTFGPNASCTRAQVVTFLWAAAGRPEPRIQLNPFTDISSSDWFYKPVMWAVENGITGGLTANTFGPNETCTRAQVVTFLYASARKPTPTSNTIPFLDVMNTDWYRNPVLWAVENDITGGIGNAMFGPNNTCTRAQVVTFLYKASQLEK